MAADVEIAVRLARMEEQMAGAMRTVETFGPVARQMLEVQHELGDCIKQTGEFREWLKDVEGRVRSDLSRSADEWGRRFDSMGDRIQSVEQQFEDYEKDRRDARLKIILAVLAGSFTLLAAIAAALVPPILGG